MKNNTNGNVLKNVGTALGVGMLAGLAGTIAMTIAQRMEMKISGREASSVPARALREIMDVEPVSESKTIAVSNKVHFLYGIDLGMIRGLIGMAGLRGMKASTLHFATIWCAELLILPALRIAPPMYKQKPETILKDALFHKIYALTTSIVFDSVYFGCHKDSRDAEDKFLKYRKMYRDRYSKYGQESRK